MPLTTEQQEILDYLKQWTSARVDELMPSASTSDAPYGYIEKELELASEFVLSHAEKHILFPAVKSGADFSKNVINEVDVQIILGVDFLRFLRLKMNGWTRPVEALYNTDSKEYDRQSFAMSKGTSYRPIAFLTPYSGSGEHSKMAIEAYDKGTDATIVLLEYIPKLECYDLPKSLWDAVVWNAASRVLSVLRYNEESKMAFNNMVMLLGGKLVGYKMEGMSDVNNSK